MTSDFSDFSVRLCEFMQGAELRSQNPERGIHAEISDIGSDERAFNELAMELFGLQFAHNTSYRRFCEARRVSPQNVMRWVQIPAVPTAAFKEFELSCLPAAERTVVFHSSGTSGQRLSRHVHNAASLAVYEASLWPWFRAHVVPDLQLPIADRQLKKTSARADQLAIGNWRLTILTPPPAQAPHSSLVHMFETVRRELDFPGSVFVGMIDNDGAWDLDWDATVGTLLAADHDKQPLILLGTAFSFVHLLEHLVEKALRFNLPAGSRAMETGGYKGRSRALPKEELHALITQRLGILPMQMVCEYGMNELSSQAYDSVSGDEWRVSSNASISQHPPPFTRRFRFPPWARVQIISPETGREVDKSEAGLIRVLDLANVYSVMAVQTEDLGIRWSDGFDLIGRAACAEVRGCSLMTV